MRVIDNRKEEQKKFDKLMIGDVFKYCDNYYLKISSFEEDYDEMNVINLSRNFADTIHQDSLVIHCPNAKLVIE